MTLHNQDIFNGNDALHGMWESGDQTGTIDTNPDDKVRTPVQAGYTHTISFV